MPHSLILTSLALLLAAAGQGEGRKRGRGPDTQDPLTLERVARYPSPGARVAAHGWQRIGMLAQPRTLPECTLVQPASSIS